MDSSKHHRIISSSRICSIFSAHRSMKKCFLLLSLITVIIFGLFSSGILDQESDKKIKPKNYFKKVARLQSMGLLINTSNCQIPNFDPRDQDVLPFIKTAKLEENCHQTHYNWSFIRDNKFLVINQSQMKLDGYFFYNGFCCYKIITRITLSKDEKMNLDDADNLIRYSSCIEINHEETELRNEFIMVECGHGMNLTSDVLPYRAWHGTGVVVQGSKVEAKIQYWKTKQEMRRLTPNVVIIGLDSTTRLNVQRNMPKMKEILEKLGAVEMLGYTKVGINTFPNFVSLMSGYNEKELEEICYFSPKTPQDDCPYIWKRFDSSQYLTALSEDQPILAIFNYKKTGFVDQPVDFYLRPLFLSGHDNGYPPFYPARKESMPCIGQYTNDEVILSYVESILNLGQKHKTPIFSISWSTRGTHEDKNYLQLIDNDYSKFMERLEKKGILENSIIFFMGDHGYYGEFRKTLMGFYEGNLPNMWILLPSWIKKQFPEWQKALEINSRRLTSPFNLYWTFNQIMDQFSSLKSPADSRNYKTGDQIPRKYFEQSFFQPVPENNSCFFIGIPEEFCACHFPQEMPLNDPLLREAAETAIIFKNNELPSICAPLSVTKITTGKKIAVSSSLYLVRFVIGFSSEPGNIGLEAQLNYDTVNKTFTTDGASLQRTNQINQNHVQCIKDAEMELFCYCR